MNDENQSRLFELFSAALQLSQQERDAYLQEVCSDEGERTMLAGLLRADLVNETSPPKLAIAGEQTLAAIRNDPGAARHAGSLLGSRLGNYILQSELGRGGMGVVYLAQQASTGQFVALKCLRPFLSAEKQVQRFEQEVQVLGKLDHVGIARVFDAGTFEIDSETQHYFAMEYVRGRSLTDYARQEQVPMHGLLVLLAAICDAVQHAHEHGVIHRDLKPANILVTTDGQPKVLDFGVSRVIDRDQQLTTLGSDGARLIGTLDYMSPEQAGGDHAHVDAASDVYAIGVMAYELLSGALPHDLGDRSLLAAVRVIRDETPGRLRDIAPNLPTEVETIVGKALEHEPGRRYPTPAALADDLRRFLRHEPIMARPPNTLYSIIKFARRHRSLVSSSLVIVIVLLVAAVASLRWALRADEARAEAEWSNYRTTLNLSEADLRQGQHSRALRNLAAVDPSMRGWEWRYLSRRTDQSAATIQEAHWLLIWSVAFSVDGKRAYSGGGDALVKSWDLASGELIAEAQDHQERVFAVAASPDGKRIATSSVDVRIRDEATLDTLAVIDGHSGTIHGLCFSPDSRLLASGDQNGTLLLSNSEHGGRVRELVGHAAFLWELAFSPTGELLASADAAGIVKIWNVASGEELLEIATDAGIAMGLAFAPSGRQVVIGSKDGVLRLASTETGQVLSTCKAHSELIRDVVFSPDGKRIISASNDRTIGVWNAESFAPVARLTGHSAAVTSLSVHADGPRLISTSEDRTIKSWDAWTLTDGNLGYPIADVVGIANGPDPSLIHTLSRASIVSNRALATGLELSVHPRADLGDRNKRSIGYGGILLGYGLKNGSQPVEQDIRAYSPDGSVTIFKDQVADWSGLCLKGRTTWMSLPDATVVLADTRTGTVQLKLSNFVADCKTLAIDNEERWIAAGDDGLFVVRIHSLDAGTELAALEGHSNSIEDLEFSPSAKWLLSASDDHTVKIWRTAGWKEIVSLDTHGAMDVRACFHPDGTRVASVSSDGIVRIWSTETWDEILAAHLPSESGRAWSIAFSPRGDQLFVVMDSGLHVLDAR